MANDEYIEELNGVVALPDHLQGTLLRFARGLRVSLLAEQAKPNPNNALISLLCDAARVGWENIELGTRADKWLHEQNEKLKRELAAIKEPGGKADQLYDSARHAERVEVQAGIDRLKSLVKEAVAALEWYGERAGSIGKRLEAFKEGKDLDYIMALLTELSLDGGKRAEQIAGRARKELEEK